MEYAPTAASTREVLGVSAHIFLADFAGLPGKFVSYLLLISINCMTINHGTDLGHSL